MNLKLSKFGFNKILEITQISLFSVNNAYKLGFSCSLVNLQKVGLRGYIRGSVGSAISIGGSNCDVVRQRLIGTLHGLSMNM